MKKLYLVSLFLIILLVSCIPLFALETTDNVDKDKFQYLVAYRFATSDLATTQTNVALPTLGNQTNQGFYYVIPRGSTNGETLPARIVGISVAGNAAVTLGGATFDVTINNEVTGIQTVLQPAPTRTAVGNTGSGGTTYGYMNQDRSETVVSQGFRGSSDRTLSFHNAEHPYGRATPIVAGDRIGVKVTTTSTFAPITTDYVVVVYVLE